MTTRPLANGRNVGVSFFFTHLKFFSGSTLLLLALFLYVFLVALGKTMRPDWCNFICLLIVLGFSGSKHWEQASVH
jgi:hypothetical protein